MFFKAKQEVDHSVVVGFNEFGQIVSEMFFKQLLTDVCTKDQERSEKLTVS